jgi:hypothetical protein
MFFNDATQKSATLVRCGIAIDTVPTWPIFEKFSHLREKGEVLTKIWLMGNSLSHTVLVSRLDTLHTAWNIFCRMRRFDGSTVQQTRTVNTHTVRFLKHLWSSITQKPSGSMLAEDESRLKICLGSRIRSQIWPGTSSSMWFFEVAILEITIRIFKLVWEILPIQPTIQPRAWHIVIKNIYWNTSMYLTQKLEVSR